jgi:hypothetical protein
MSIPEQLGQTWWWRVGDDAGNDFSPPAPPLAGGGRPPCNRTVVPRLAAREATVLSRLLPLEAVEPGVRVVRAKMLRLELLKVKADLERELEDFVLNSSKCGLDVHWVSGLGIIPGHWAHREPAPHGEPAV